MRVSLIEDDQTTAPQSIELMLKSESFNIYITDFGEEGIDLNILYDYDLNLLDLNPPDMSGFEVLRSLRVSKVKTPILILSGLTGIEHKISGRLRCRAVPTTTLLSPFTKTSWLIHAIVRRSQGHAQSRSYRVATLMAGSPQSADVTNSTCAADRRGF
jgi:two-component system, cell cycle response regulator CtrA